MWILQSDCSTSAGKLEVARLPQNNVSFCYCLKRRISRFLERRVFPQENKCLKKYKTQPLTEFCFPDAKINETLIGLAIEPTFTLMISHQSRKSQQQNNR